MREWSEVAAEARKHRKEVHLWVLYEICVEKVSELAPEFRKYKGRGVFLGSQIKNQNWDAAMFQDFGVALHP